MCSCDPNNDGLVRILTFWSTFIYLSFCHKWRSIDKAKIVKDGPSLSHQHKFTLLKSHFRLRDNYVFPKTKQNNKMRSFQASWLKTYPWLVYSASEDGGYC